MKNKNLIIVDANNRAWAAFYAYSRLSYEGESVSIIYGLPSMVKALKSKFKDSDLIIVWDGNRDSHREAALPNYKGDREKKELIDWENWISQKRTVQRIFNFLGVTQVMNPKMEADDLIHILAMTNRKKYKKIILSSGDKDFNQSLRRAKGDKGSVVIFNEAKKLLITADNVQEHFGYKYNQTVDYLTLVGDKSDSIPGYPGIGHKRALDLLSKYGSLANFLSSSDNHNLIDKEKLLEIVNTNLILIDLTHFYKNYIKGDKTRKIEYLFGEKNPKQNAKKFRRLASKFNMVKLMGNSFIEKFKN